MWHFMKNKIMKIYPMLINSLERLINSNVCTNSMH